jgi:UDP-glucose 4-epimerase
VNGNRTACRNTDGIFITDADYKWSRKMSYSDSSFSDTRIFITGGSGFIGSHLIQQLQGEGAIISLISREKIPDNKGIKRYIGDIRDFSFVESSIRDFEPELIFHLAAYKERSEEIPAFRSSIETNLIGSLNIFSAAASLGSLKSIVTLGTAEEYGHDTPPFNEKAREDPVTPYSFSKVCVSHMGELFFHLYNLPVTIIRPTLAYGPGQGTDMFLPALVNSLLENKPFAMTSGEQTRDFVYVADLVDALIIASQNPGAQGQIFNIGSGVPVRLAEIARKTEILTGKQGLVNLGAKSYRKNEVMEYYADVRNAEQILGWKSKISLDDGLARTIGYYRGVRNL